MSFLVPEFLETTPSNKPYTVLFDSGSTSTWIARRCLPPDFTPCDAPPLTGTTLAGPFTSKAIVHLFGVRLPEFRRNVSLTELKARVFDNDCRYDIIMGRNTLQVFRIQLDFDKNMIRCGTTERPMQHPPTTSPGDEAKLALELMLDHMELSSEFDSPPLAHDDMYFPSPMSDLERSTAIPSDPSWNESDQDALASAILPSKYDATDIETIVRRCTHLCPQQQDDLLDVLSRFPKLFNNELDVYPHEKIHLDIDPTISPHITHAYPVPRSQLQLFKDELDRLVSIGVLEPGGRSEWISGTFITPKKDSRVRWVSDFRALNKAIKRRVYPIPRIQDILSRRNGYKFLSKLDISMQYYTFKLDDESKELCTIATPFGLYCYRRLPMGISTSPDIAQEIMERVLALIEDIEIYIDDIACFSNAWRDHMNLLKVVLERLEANGFCVNPLKCEWAVQETDFLGHWLTPTGVKPWSKKVDSILAMKPPTNLSELRTFLGLVTYYRDMWPRRSHILAPLTDLLKTPKLKTFVWTSEHQTAFTRMKALVASGTLLAYPDHNVPFDIETDASDFQLGAVIKQKGRPVAYYTRKLNPAQRNYTTIEKELLSIVETLREFRSMLLGSTINVYTDHHNLTHRLSLFTTQRVLRWRILIEEFNPTFYYLPGPRNVVADALSRLPISEAAHLNAVPSATPVRHTRDSPASTFCDTTLTESLAECLLAMPVCDAQRTDGPRNDVARDDVTPNDSQSAAPPPQPADEAYLFHPKFDPQGRHPFHFATIHQYQQQDKQLLALPAITQRVISSRLSVLTRFFVFVQPKHPTHPGASAFPTPCCFHLSNGTTNIPSTPPAWIASSNCSAVTFTTQTFGPRSGESCRLARFAPKFV